MPNQPADLPLTVARAYVLGWTVQAAADRAGVSTRWVRAAMDRYRVPVRPHRTTRTRAAALEACFGAVPNWAERTEDQHRIDVAVDALHDLGVPAVAIHPMMWPKDRDDPNSEDMVAATPTVALLDPFTGDLTAVSPLAATWLNGDHDRQWDRYRLDDPDHPLARADGWAGTGPASVAWDYAPGYTDPVVLPVPNIAYLARKPYDFHAYLQPGCVAVEAQPSDNVTAELFPLGFDDEFDDEFRVPPGQVRVTYRDADEHVPAYVAPVVATAATVRDFPVDLADYLTWLLNGLVGNYVWLPGDGDEDDGTDPVDAREAYRDWSVRDPDAADRHVPGPGTLGARIAVAVTDEEDGDTEFVDVVAALQADTLYPEQLPWFDGWLGEQPWMGDPDTATGYRATVARTVNAEPDPVQKQINDGLRVALMNQDDRFDYSLNSWRAWVNPRSVELWLRTLPPELAALASGDPAWVWHPNPAVRYWVARNARATADMLTVLAGDPDPQVRYTVTRHRHTTPAALQRLTSDQDPVVAESAATQWTGRLSAPGRARRRH